MSDGPRLVFVDRAGWIALVNTSDALNSRAVELMGALQQSKTMLVTTEFVLLEVADALSASQLRSRTVAYIEWLRRWSQVHIILADHQLLLDGWRLYSQRPDKDWGLTDCTSFVIMTHEHIGSAFTSDRHFQQAGFVKLL